MTCSKPHRELGTSPRSRSSAQTRPLPQQLPGPLGAGCPEGCGREMHKRTYEWNVCFARGQAGGAGFQKVGASAERTACAERGLRGLRVLARSWLAGGALEAGPTGPGRLAPHPEGQGLGCSEAQRERVHREPSSADITRGRIPHKCHLLTRHVGLPSLTPDNPVKLALTPHFKGEEMGCEEK